MLFAEFQQARHMSGRARFRDFQNPDASDHSPDVGLQPDVVVSYVLERCCPASSSSVLSSPGEAGEAGEAGDAGVTHHRHHCRHHRHHHHRRHHRHHPLCLAPMSTRHLFIRIVCSARCEQI